MTISPLCVRYCLQSGVLDICNSAHIHRHDTGLVLVDKWSHLLRNRPDIGKEDASLDSKDQQAGKFLIIGILLRTRSKDIGTPLASEDVYGRIGDLVCEGKERNNDCNKNSFERSDKNNPGESNHCPYELSAPNAED